MTRRDLHHTCLPVLSLALFLGGTPASAQTPELRLAVQVLPGSGTPVEDALNSAEEARDRGPRRAEPPRIGRPLMSAPAMILSTDSTLRTGAPHGLTGASRAAASGPPLPQPPFRLLGGLRASLSVRSAIRSLYNRRMVEAIVPGLRRACRMYGFSVGFSF